MLLSLKPYTMYTSQTTDWIHIIFNRFLVIYSAPTSKSSNRSIIKIQYYRIKRNVKKVLKPWATQCYCLLFSRLSDFCSRCFFFQKHIGWLPLAITTHASLDLNTVWAAFPRAPDFRSLARVTRKVSRSKGVFRKKPSRV